MLNYLRKTVTPKDESKITALYRERGLNLIKSSKDNVTGLVILEFEGNRSEVADLFESGDEASIQFEDGVVSPLYIRRERNFWDD